MDDNTKQSFLIMLKANELPAGLEEKYEKVKYLNDTISGGRLSAGIMALLAYEFVDAKVKEKKIAWSEVSENTSVYTMDGSGLRRTGAFKSVIAGGRDKGKLVIHFDNDSSSGNTVVPKDEVHIKEE
jgi:hypothetical protein